MQLSKIPFILQDQSKISTLKKCAFTSVLLFLTLFLIYGNSLENSWHYDDEPNIRDNPNIHLKELKWEQIKRAFFADLRDPETLYRPVTCLSFALNYYFGGLDVFGFHIVNISIHLLTSIFLFLFIYHTLNLPTQGAKYASRSWTIATLATLLWAVNPIQTQAITFIVQRMASLAGLFYIMSMFLYLKARIADGRGRSTLYFILCASAALLSFGSKENTALLPIALFLYEILLIRDKPGILKNKKGIQWFFIIVGVTALIGLAYLYYLYGNVFSFMSGYEQRPFSMQQRLLTEFRIIIFYMTLIIYPLPGRLSLIHSFDISNSLLSPISTLLAVIFVIGTIGYLLYRSRRWPLISFSFLFFFLNHIIESTIFPLELVYEHRNYLPSMLFFLPVSLGFFYLLDLYSTKKFMQAMVSVFILFLIIGFGHATFLRNYAWVNEESLWLDTVEKAPDQFRAHHNLGKVYQGQGAPEKAISEYQKALNSPLTLRNDEIFITHYNLGRLWDALEDYEKAKSSYQKALMIRPNFAQALMNLSVIYQKEGKGPLADQYLFSAFEANPNDPIINYNMGLYSLRNRNPEKAIQHFILLRPEQKSFKNVSMYLGIAYKQMGLYDRASAYFRESLRLNPKNITPRLHLLEIFSRTGYDLKAREETRKVVDLMIKDKTLFDQSIDIIASKGHLGHVLLSGDILLPLILEGYHGKSNKK